MTPVSSQITEQLLRFRQGDRDSAFFAFVEMDHGVLPDLMSTFRAESDRDIRAFLIEVIWQHRQQSVIPFFGEALRDSEPMVWKEAMDGLVALACPAALDVLRSARSRQLSRPQDAAEFQRWLEEAIKQASGEQNSDSRKD
jgi:hypothetical protein